MFCNAIIKYGKNSGKICGRISCKIRGHEKYVQDIGKCQNIIKFGKNKNKECGRINCHFHNKKIPSNFNIAKYLNLPECFINIVENNKWFFKTKFNIKYLSIYQNHLILNKINKDCVSDIIIILHDCENRFYIENKIILVIFLFKLLDTVNMNWFINNHENFRKMIDIKIIENQNQNLIYYPEFSQYFKENYEINKKYLSIKLNKEHRKKIFKKYMLSLVIFYILYMKVIHNRYKPGGVGYYECEKSFYKNCLELEMLKNI